MTFGELKHRTDVDEEPQSTGAPKDLIPAGYIQQSSAGRPGKIAQSSLLLPASLAHTAPDPSMQGSA